MRTQTLKSLPGWHSLLHVCILSSFQVDRYSGDLRYVGPSGATSSGAKTYHMVLVARDPAGHETSARLSVEMETTEVPVGTPTLYAQGTSTTTTVISGSSTLNPRVFLTVRTVILLDDVLTRKRFPHYWPLVRGIPHRGSVLQNCDNFWC